MRPSTINEWQFQQTRLIDEACREGLALIVARRLKHEDMLATLIDLLIERGPHAHIKSNSGSEFIATAVQV